MFIFGGMFNIGPMEFVVLVVVGLIVFGLDRLFEMVKDAVWMIRMLRDMVMGVRL